jgi:hypothetical protein
MTRSTPRTGLSKPAALLIALTLAMAWAQSSLVLADTTVGAGDSTLGGASSGATRIADPRLDALAGSSFGWLFGLHEQRDLVSAAPILEAKQAKPPKATAASTKVIVAAAKPTYSGRNRFWIPSLGMSYKVRPFECTRNRPPDNYMYRWGCAGTNNVYILGHAYSVMKPLHDLYVAGKLKQGMVAIYADGQGHVHWFKVTEWRVVEPTEAAWAIADQPVPSMTLQTCVGKDGRYRLNVRLVQFR